MKKHLALILILIPVITFSQDFKYNYKNKGLRVDYIHSGNDEGEDYQLKEFIEEKYYAGNQLNLIDTFDYGNYRFEMRDLASDEVLYSRGYSSLFREWQATEKAKYTYKSFPESVSMPYPRDPVKIEFYSRKKDMSWTKTLSIHFHPEKTQIKNHRNYKFKKSKVHYSGKPEDKVDIVILAEGYTKDEMKKFKKDIKRFKDIILGAKPFNTNQDKINIWAVHSVSEESGTDFPVDNQNFNTILNSNFYTFDSERYLTTMDYHRVKDVAGNAPCDQIYILVNHEKYGGGGIYNFYSIGTSDNPQAGFLFQHEFGHAFAGLGDEYYTSEVAVEDFYPLNTEPWEPNLTTMIDFDSKWKNMIDEDTPVPTPVEEKYNSTLGAYEGGGYVAKGVFRPYIDCTMKSVKYDAFCPVCQRAIQQMINFYSRGKSKSEKR